jgi:hypothetical protein
MRLELKALGLPRGPSRERASRNSRFWKDAMEYLCGDELVRPWRVVAVIHIRDAFVILKQ